MLSYLADKALIYGWIWSVSLCFSLCLGSMVMGACSQHIEYFEICAKICMQNMIQHIHIIQNSNKFSLSVLYGFVSSNCAFIVANRLVISFYHLIHSLHITGFPCGKKFIITKMIQQSALMQMDIHRIWMKPYLIENQRMKLFCASIMQDCTVLIISIVSYRTIIRVGQWHYPDVSNLKHWYREYSESNDLHQGRKKVSKFSDKEKLEAVDYYFAHGRNALQGHQS